MNTILEDIVAAKRKRLIERKQELPLARLRELLPRESSRGSFKTGISRQGRTNIIAEIKRASPSAGIIRNDFDPAAIAAEYGRSGAAAVSVLTEEDHFKGDLRFLRTAKEHSRLPVLRKDFLFDPYQVYEARAFGADALLLIAAILDAQLLRELLALAGETGLDCLVEVHDETELETALRAGAEIIGVNNRNLRDFSVDLTATERIARALPDDRVLVAESGIRTRRDIERLSTAGVDAFLIGEAFMRSADISAKMKELLTDTPK